MGELKKFEPYGKRYWWLSGWAVGVFLFVFMDLIVQPYFLDNKLTTKGLLFGFVAFSLMGIVYGRINYASYKKKLAKD